MLIFDFYTELDQYDLAKESKLLSLFSGDTAIMKAVKKLASELNIEVKLQGGQVCKVTPWRSMLSYSMKGADYRGSNIEKLEDLKGKDLIALVCILVDCPFIRDDKAMEKHEKAEKGAFKINSDTTCMFLMKRILHPAILGLNNYQNFANITNLLYSLKKSNLLNEKRFYQLITNGSVIADPFVLSAINDSVGTNDKPWTDTRWDSLMKALITKDPKLTILEFLASESGKTSNLEIYKRIYLKESDEKISGEERKFNQP